MNDNFIEQKLCELCGLIELDKGKQFNKILNVPINTPSIQLDDKSDAGNDEAGEINFMTGNVDVRESSLQNIMENN